MIFWIRSSFSKSLDLCSLSFRSVVRWFRRLWSGLDSCCPFGHYRTVYLFVKRQVGVRKSGRRICWWDYRCGRDFYPENTVVASCPARNALPSGSASVADGMVLVTALEADNRNMEQLVIGWKAALAFVAASSALTTLGVFLLARFTSAFDAYAGERAKLTAQFH